jgi:hypothetical protein
VTLPHDQAEEEARTLLAPIIASEARPEAPEVRAARRDRLVPELERRIRQAPRVRRRATAVRAGVRAAWVALPLAAAALLALGGLPKLAEPEAPEATAAGVTPIPRHQLTTTEGAALRHHAGRGRAVLAGEQDVVAPGDSVETIDDGRAHLRTVAGASVELGSGTRLRVPVERGEKDERLLIDGGRVHVRVPRMGPGRSFGVRSPNAEVVVHGTEFVVEVSGDRPGVTRTCVRVLEGLVSIDHGAGQAWVAGGQRWGCDGAREAREPAALPERRTRGRAALPSTTLATENTLMRAALAAERRGDHRDALRIAKRLLARFPDSPHAPEVRALQERLASPR